MLQEWIKSVVSRLDDPGTTDRLTEYSLYVAKLLAYPDLDIQSTIASLSPVSQRIAERIKKSTIQPARPTFIIEQINECLFVENGFKPNVDDYYNPLNSYLNVVIQRKTGIPITLCILYIHVARSVGFGVDPVSFPAHFLVKHVMDGENGEIIIDPFNRGRIMDDYSLKSLLERTFPGQKISLTRSFVERATPSQVLVRMLSNLKVSYQESQDSERYARANEMILAIDPYHPEAMRDKGLILLNDGERGEALRTLDTYLEINPEADDADDVLAIIKRLRDGSQDPATHTSS